MFVTLIGAFGLYFVKALLERSTAEPELIQGLNVQPTQVIQFIVVVGLMVVVQTIRMIAIAIADRRSGTDERDRWFALKGTRNGSYVLATGVAFSLFTAV